LRKSGKTPPARNPGRGKKKTIEGKEVILLQCQMSKFKVQINSKVQMENILRGPAKRVVSEEGVRT
jgi:hypothetical protein